jgi:hypothetical protein
MRERIRGTSGIEGGATFEILFRYRRWRIVLVSARWREVRVGIGRLRRRCRAESVMVAKSEMGS